MRLHRSRNPDFSCGQYARESVRSIKLSEENPHRTQGALRLLEQALPRRHEMRWVAVPGRSDGLDFAQTAREPDRRNELPPVLGELGRPMRRTSVTLAFPDAVVDAASGLEQFGLRLLKRWAAQQALEWIAAFLGPRSSLVFCLSFPMVYTET
jgi:hypothetical protein